MVVDAYLSVCQKVRWKSDLPLVSNHVHIPLEPTSSSGIFLRVRPILHSIPPINCIYRFSDIDFQTIPAALILNRSWLSISRYMTIKNAIIKQPMGERRSMNFLPNTNKVQVDGGEIWNFPILSSYLLFINKGTLRFASHRDQNERQ